MNPRFPVYIPSKGRADSRLTMKALEHMGVPYHVIVEHQEYDAYAAVIDPAKLLVLDPAYQRNYESCDDLGMTKSLGPGPARNFAWDHSVAQGHAWHWVMDDNIRSFVRLNRNSYRYSGDGSLLHIMESFALRYLNVAMVGPNYKMFAPCRAPMYAYVPNTRIYSCNLIRNDVPFRWRGRYNEDTDLSLRMLKAGWCTVLFNAFLQWKLATQQIKGGNSDDFYFKEGTLPKSRMLVKLHPDVTRLVWRWHRWHHFVDYRPFRKLKLIRRPDTVVAEGVDEHGLREEPSTRWSQDHG